MFFYGMYPYLFKGCKNAVISGVGIIYPDNVIQPHVDEIEVALGGGLIDWQGERGSGPLVSSLPKQVICERVVCR